MSIRNLLLTTACALAAAAGLHAQGPCMSFMASGVYMTKIAGQATLATTPMLVVAPAAAMVLTRIDDSGNMTALSPLTIVVAGKAETDALSSSKLTVASDCSVTFKATCAGGCTWEGSGFLLRNGPTKEIHLIFTKMNGYPLTGFVEMKQISN